MENSHATLTEPFIPRYDEDFKTLQELTEEILGYRWEFIMCDSCNIVLWKNEVFWHPKWWHHIKTIREMMEERWIKCFSCTSCWKNMRFMYGEEYISKLRKRCIGSVENFLTVSKNQDNKIVWYSHCYVAEFPFVFDDELRGHFRNIWLKKVHSDVERVLGTSVGKIYFKSFLWLKEDYTSPANTFEQIQKTKFPIDPIPSLAEVDRNQNLYSIYKNIWWHEIRYDKREMTDASSDAHWVLITSENPADIHRRYLSWWIRQYLRETRKKRL